MNQNKFIIELEKLGINLNKKQIDQLEQYYELLVDYNQKMNLTGITEKEEVYLKHFYDCLTMFKIIDLNNYETLCDIGTGAGFPGLVLKIVFPNLKVTLLDSLNKRLNFLNIVIEKLDLKDIYTIHARAEEFGKDYRNKFDVTTSRAVSHLSNLLEYAIPMTKVNGYFVALKGNVEEEINEARSAIKVLDASLEEKIEFKLPIEDSNRTLLKFKKLKDNKKYPRKNSEIKKSRL